MANSNKHAESGDARQHSKLFMNEKTNGWLTKTPKKIGAESINFQGKTLMINTQDERVHK